MEYCKDESLVDLDSILGELSALESQLTISIEEEQCQPKYSGQSSVSAAAASHQRHPPAPSNGQEQCNEVNASLMSALEELNGVQYGVQPTTPVRLATPLSSMATPPHTPHRQRPSSTTGVSMGRVTFQTPQLDVDSAYSDDNSSLPSSGSRVSVATSASASSSNSATSSGMGVSNTASPTSEPCTSLNDDKDAKVRVALEKIKEANIKKMFIRVETDDATKRSILIDETMTVAQICDILAVKSRTRPNLQWSIVEQLTDLYMERMLEDHEYLVDYLQSWSPDSVNNLMYKERRDKYDILLRPERYLLVGTDAEDRDFSEEERNVLINEYFCSSQNKIPKMESYLYLKVDGKKAWKKIYCVLRFSGIYYNPKGKVSKNSKDLVCLQNLDFIETFTAIGWKKKYKAPTEYGFALKHSRIQKVVAKYIKYLCADNAKTMAQWIGAIRAVKMGEQLVHNFVSSKENIQEWDPNKVILEPQTSENRHVRMAGDSDSSLMGCVSVPQKFHQDKKQMSATNTPLLTRRSNELETKKTTRSSSVDLLESCTIRRKLPNMQLADITATTAQVLTRTSTDPDLLPQRSHLNRPSSCDMKSAPLGNIAPPAPPKRGLQTKLSFKSFSSQNSVNINGSHSSIGSNRTSHSDCTDGHSFNGLAPAIHPSSTAPATPVKPKSQVYMMADLQRTLATKQNPAPGGSNVKGCESDDSMDDLPPPPPELIASNPRIPPPTPPKRNLASH